MKIGVRSQIGSIVILSGLGQTRFELTDMRSHWIDEIRLEIQTVCQNPA